MIMPISKFRQTRLANASSALKSLAMATAVLFSMSPIPAFSATSGSESSPAVVVELITAENWVAPGASSISAGIELSLSDGWKTYWRSPGEVGYPPDIDFTTSDNVASVEILWPAPERFTAFGIQNFGYSGNVVLPLRINLERPGDAAQLRANVSLLVCSNVCVPADFSFSLNLPSTAVAPSDAIDQRSADRIATFAARVPLEGPSEFVSEVESHVDVQARMLTITARGTRPFEAPDVFPEMGLDTAFGPPDIRLGDGGLTLWAQLPILTMPEDVTDPIITITDGPLAATLQPTALTTAPAAPFTLELTQASAASLAWIALVAVLGGLILNAMPCVLPVLSIKLASAVSGGGKSRREIRAGFLSSALGVLTFMWFLAAVIYGLQQIGITVGWGLQFQNPVFLALMVMILAVFAANMLGLFDIALPTGLQTRLANSGAKNSYAGDFATGAFAAVLATPCSAPFLGTAIAFALAGRGIDIAVVFTGLGVGLGLPYLAVAIWPGVVQLMPKPGRWMIIIKALLGALLLLTAGWLVWVMIGVAGQTATYAIISLIAALIGLLSFSRLPHMLRWSGIAVLTIAPLFAANQLSDTGTTPVSTVQTEWVVFNRAEIARYGARCFLIGESLMRQEDVTDATRRLLANPLVAGH